MDGPTPLRVVFSGDLGRWNRPILRDPEFVPEADVLLVESTYGDRTHPPDPADAVDGMVIDLPSGWEGETKARREAVRPLDPGIRFSHRLVTGEEAAEIVRLAVEAKADLIVMGTHGRTGRSRLLLGSLAEHVMRRARC